MRVSHSLLPLLLALTAPRMDDDDVASIGFAPVTRGHASAILMSDRKAYNAAYEKGRKEAEAELRAGSPTMYTYGLPTSFFENLDQETGLPLMWIAGCLVDDEIEGRATGHNEAIVASIRKDGLPKSSFKPWAKELFDLNALWAAESRIHNPLELTPGTMLKSPDGKLSLQVYELPDETQKLHPGSLVLASPKTRPEDLAERGYSIARGSRLLWGPPESAFVVIENPGSDWIRFTAIGVKRLNLLRCETSHTRDSTRKNESSATPVAR